MTNQFHTHDEVIKHYDHMSLDQLWYELKTQKNIGGSCNEELERKYHACKSIKEFYTVIFPTVDQQSLNNIAYVQAEADIEGYFNQGCHAFIYTLCFYTKNNQKIELPHIAISPYIVKNDFVKAYNPFTVLTK